METDKGYTRLGIHHYDKKGKAVYAFQCNICKGKFTNYNNAAAHVSSCRISHANAIDQRAFPILQAFGITPAQLPLEAVIPVKIKARSEPGAPLSHEFEALLELFADMNIPYTQIESPSWEKFIHALNPGLKIPKKDTLRTMIIEHSSTLLKEGLNDVKGTICGVAVDGAKIFDNHTYAFILVHPHGLRLAGIKTVDDQKGVTLAQATADIINTCHESGINVSGVVSDNGPSLVAALTNMDPDDPLSLRVLIGMTVLRLACAAHTSQLAVNDVMKTYPILEQFFKDITSLLYWINKRCEEFKAVCSLKIPQYVATRWNTLASCGVFIINNKETINDFISRRTEEERVSYQRDKELFDAGRKRTAPVEPVPPPVEAVPECWNEYVDALKVIATFTDMIEGDLQLQQQVYTSVISTEAQLENMGLHGNVVASKLLVAFRNRFKATADIELAHLAFTFTPDGLQAFQTLPEGFEKRTTAKTLKKKFLEIASNLNVSAIGPSAVFLPAIFDNYLKYASIGEGEDPFIYWEERCDETIVIPQVNNGQSIKLTVFSTIALILISLPASEAMVERAFSQMKAISTDFNKCIAKDLFLALSTIKLCVRIKRKYQF